MLIDEFLCKREVLGKRAPHSFTPPLSVVGVSNRCFLDMNFTRIVVITREENNNLFLLRTLINWSRAKRKQVSRGRYYLIKIANLVDIEKSKEVDMSMIGHGWYSVHHIYNGH
jgi:hypothetical protein